MGALQSFVIKKWLIFWILPYPIVVCVQLPIRNNDRSNDNNFILFCA